MLQKIIKLAILLSTLLLLWNCTVSLEEENKIALQIGDVSVTEYEIEQQYEKAFQGKQEVSPEEIKRFEEEILKKYYILADAKAKGYDTIADIRKRVEHASNFMMSVKGGYVWKRTVLPQLEAAAKMTDDKLQRRKRNYYFDVIQSNNKDAFIKFLNNDTLITTKKQYDAIVAQVPKHSWIRQDKASLQWPFAQYMQLGEELEKMNPGQVAGILEIQNYCFVFCLDSVGDVEITEPQRAKFENELKYYAEYTIINKLFDDMLTKGEPKINMAAVKPLTDYIEAGNPIAEYQSQDTLISYTIAGVREHLTLPEYIDILAYSLQTIEIKSGQQLVNNLNQAFNNRYFVHEALKLNLFSDEEFLLDKTNYENDLLYKNYIKQEVTAGITVESAEVSDYYSAHPEEFQVPSTLTADVFMCNTLQEAGQAYSNLRMFYMQNPPTARIDPRRTRMVKKTLRDQKIDKNDLNAFTSEDQQEVFTLQKGSLSQVVSYQGQPSVLLVTAAEGSTNIPIEMVFDQIQDALQSSKLEARLNTHVEQLKQAHKAEINKLDADIFRYRHLNN